MRIGNARRWTVCLLLICLAACEEWYIPNSRMISDVQFKQKIQNDARTYKLVKFFTPHCVYCRYLKSVIDDLKAEKKWPFQIYDVNCAWYPALCNSLQISSYPFMGVFNPKGEIQNRIVGFYPYPVVKQYFQDIEKACQQLKQTNQNSLSTHQDQQPISKDQPKAEQKPKQDKQSLQNVVVVQQVKQIDENPKVIAQHSQSAHLDGIYHHIFCSICILLGVVYFSSFANRDKFTKESATIHHNPQKDENNASLKGEQVSFNRNT